MLHYVRCFLAGARIELYLHTAETLQRRAGRLFEKYDPNSLEATISRSKRQ